jgi:hypothetical protein
MQTIINFPNVSAPAVEEACAKMASEYYRTPHGWANGYSRQIRPDGRMLGMRSGRNWVEDNLPWKSPDEFWARLWADRREDGVHVESWEQADRIGGGYHATIDGDRVVWETYHACSGNFVAIRHHGDGSATLYVDSARHGIPELARPFYGREDGEGILYTSWRKDVPWWQAGITPHAPGSKGWETQQEIERAQRVRELAERRAQRLIEETAHA